MAQIQSSPVCGLLLAAEKDYVDKPASFVSNTGQLLTGVAYECFRGTLRRHASGGDGETSLVIRCG